MAKTRKKAPKKKPRASAQRSLPALANGRPCIGPFHLTAVGLEGVDGEPSFDQWAGAVRTMRLAERSCMWIVGDLLNYGETRFGEDFSQVLDDVGYADETLGVAKWVAARFPKDRRVEVLTFTHHQLVAGLEPADADKLLADAVTEKLSTRQLKDRLQNPAGTGDGEIMRLTLPPPDQPEEYVSIYADPARCGETVARCKKKTRELVELLSSLVATPHGPAVLEAAKGYLRRPLTATGGQVKTGEMGPVTFGFKEYTCDPLDELMGLWGGLGVTFERLGRGEVPGAGVGEWEVGK
jgi:hypothetical protein